MNEVEAVADLADQVFADSVHGRPRTRLGCDRATWDRMHESGLTQVGDPDSGGSLAMVTAVLQAAGRHAVALPVAEAVLLAPWVGRQTGIAVNHVPTAVAWHGLCVERRDAGPAVVGRAPRIPWGAAADDVFLIAQGSEGCTVARSRSLGLDWHTAENIADEPRDDLELSGVEVLDGGTNGPAELPGGVATLARFARAAELSGAIGLALALTRRHVAEREQFGRSLARFQVVQHKVVKIAAQDEATRTAVRAAERALTMNGPIHPRASLAVLAAKSQASRAAVDVARLAHQLHGAIGFTDEHVLHLTTRRLWAWAAEEGSLVEVDTALGERIVEHGDAWDAVSWGRISSVT